MGRPVRYSGSIMSEPPPLDPIRFTRQLCEIESTTYNEGAVGDFLAHFLSQRGSAA
jgi:acetylornithine deacetylase